MENKTINDEFESKFGDFERQFASMHDPHPDEIREFITTVILAAAHDNSLVDAAFKWVENKNNTPNKAIEDYTKLLVKILLEDVKDGKLIMEKQESDPDKKVVVNFLFTPGSCTKKIKITFDYDELTKKINCSKTILDDNMSKDKNPYFTFDTKTTEEWTYELTEEEKDRFKHLPTPCAVIGFTPKNSVSHKES